MANAERSASIIFMRYPTKEMENANLALTPNAEGALMMGSAKIANTVIFWMKEIKAVLKPVRKLVSISTLQIKNRRSAGNAWKGVLFAKERGANIVVSVITLLMVFAYRGRIT